MNEVIKKGIYFGIGLLIGAGIMVSVYFGTDASGTLRRAQSEAESLRVQLSDANTQISAITGGLEESNRKLDISNAELADSTKRLKDITGRLASANTQLRVLTNQIDGYRKQIGDYETAIGSLNGTISGLENQVGDLRGRIADLEGQVGSNIELIRCIIARLSNTDNELGGAISAIQQAIDGLRANIEGTD
jgi:chromosome segregation ATPase